MDPWYKVATRGKNYAKDALSIRTNSPEQVVAGNAPEDYRDPEKFFSRTAA